MQHTPTPIGDETEPTIIERSVQPCESQIGSFAWHPSSQNRMVVVSAANRVMTDFTVFERISLAWSSTTSLMWACGRHLYDCVEDGAEGVESMIEKDIATKMRERAQSRYGHDTIQVWRNHLLAGGNDPQLKSLWFDLFYILFDDEVVEMPAQWDTVYLGITIIVSLLWFGAPGFWSTNLLTQLLIKWFCRDASLGALRLSLISAFSQLMGHVFITLFVDFKNLHISIENVSI